MSSLLSNMISTLQICYAVPNSCSSIASRLLFLVVVDVDIVEGSRGIVS